MCCCVVGQICLGAHFLVEVIEQKMRERESGKAEKNHLDARNVDRVALDESQQTDTEKCPCNHGEKPRSPSEFRHT